MAPFHAIEWLRWMKSNIKAAVAETKYNLSNVIIYIATEPREGTKSTSKYVEAIRSGAAENQLSNNYVSKLNQYLDKLAVY